MPISETWEVFLISLEAHQIGGCRGPFNQELGGAFQTSVVRRGFDIEKATHERVDVHLEDGGGFNSLAEVGSPREEDGFHGLELAAITVTSFSSHLPGSGHILSDCKELAL